MRGAIGITVFLVLASIAAFHAYWAFGGIWPASSEQSLINTVIGAPMLHEMPPKGKALAVAALILASGFVALFASGALAVLPPWLSRIAAFGAGLVFLARGIAGLAGLSIFKTWVVEPFATLNVQYYSPLCLVIGLAFLYFSFSQRPPQSFKTA